MWIAWEKLKLKIIRKILRSFEIFEDPMKNLKIINFDVYLKITRKTLRSLEIFEDPMKNLKIL